MEKTPVVRRASCWPLVLIRDKRLIAGFQRFRRMPTILGVDRDGLIEDAGRIVDLRRAGRVGDAQDLGRLDVLFKHNPIVRRHFKTRRDPGLRLLRVKRAEPLSGADAGGAHNLHRNADRNAVLLDHGVRLHDVESLAGIHLALIVESVRDAFLFQRHRVFVTTVRLHEPQYPDQRVPVH